jgi:uncharacterized membrane protein YhiD involved in acid resistance
MAAIGIACGIGMILPALVTSGMMLFVLFLIPLAERAILPRGSANLQHLHIEVASFSGQSIASIYDICQHNKVNIEKLTIQPEQEGEVIDFICRIPDKVTLSKVIGELHILPDMKAIRATPHSLDA